MFTNNTNNKVSEIVSYKGAEITEKEDFSYDHNNREVERRVYDFCAFLQKEEGMKNM